MDASPGDSDAISALSDRVDVLAAYFLGDNDADVAAALERVEAQSTLEDMQRVVEEEIDRMNSPQDYASDGSESSTAPTSSDGSNGRVTQVDLTRSAASIAHQLGQYAQGSTFTWGAAFLTRIHTIATDNGFSLEARRAHLDAIQRAIDTYPSKPDKGWSDARRQAERLTSEFEIASPTPPAKTSGNSGKVK